MPTLDARASRIGWRLHAGSSATLTLVAEDTDGEPVDLTGHTLTVTTVTRVDGEDVTATITATPADPAAGTRVWSLTGEHTDAVKVARAAAFAIEDADGDEWFVGPVWASTDGTEAQSFEVRATVGAAQVNAVVSAAVGAGGTASSGPRSFFVVDADTDWDQLQAQLAAAGWGWKFIAVQGTVTVPEGFELDLHGGTLISNGSDEAHHRSLLCFADGATLVGWPARWPIFDRFLTVVSLSESPVLTTDEPGFTIGYGVLVAAAGGAPFFEMTGPVTNIFMHESRLMNAATIAAHFGMAELAELPAGPVLEVTDTEAVFAKVIASGTAMLDEDTVVSPVPFQWEVNDAGPRLLGAQPQVAGGDVVKVVSTHADNIGFPNPPWVVRDTGGTVAGMLDEMAHHRLDAAFVLTPDAATALDPTSTFDPGVKLTIPGFAFFGLPAGTPIVVHNGTPGSEGNGVYVYDGDANDGTFAWDDHQLFTAEHSSSLVSGSDFFTPGASGQSSLWRVTTNTGGGLDPIGGHALAATITPTGGQHLSDVPVGKVPGRLYGRAEGVTMTTVALGSNAAGFDVWRAPWDCTIDRLFVDITSADTDRTVRLALYALDGDDVPTGDPVEVLDEFTTTDGAAIYSVAFDQPVALTRGEGVAFGVQVSASTTFRARNGSGPSGIDPASFTSAQSWRQTVAFASGAPTAAPSPHTSQAIMILPRVAS